MNRMKSCGVTALFIVLATFNYALQVQAKKKWGPKLQASIDGLQAAMEEGIRDLKSALESLENKVQNIDCCETERACPEGWSKFEQSCYLYVDKGLPWEEAKGNCEALGGYLAEVQSEGENEFIFSLFDGKYDSRSGPWLGGNDKDTEGQWYWSNSGQLLGYTNWNTNEPNGGTNENCLHYRLYTHPRWNDMPCKEAVGSICEK